MEESLIKEWVEGHADDWQTVAATASTLKYLFFSEVAHYGL